MARRKPWTEAGAGRHAREMRAATAQYLRRSAFARQAKLSDLYDQFDQYQYMFGAATGAVAEKLGAYGYPPPYPREEDDLEEVADRIVSDEAEYLAHSELYIIEPHMADVVATAASTLTIQDLELLGPDDLPSPTGVLIWPEPLQYRTVIGTVLNMRALTWQTPAHSYLPMPEDPRGAEGVRIGHYTDPYASTMTYEQRAQVEQLALLQGGALPPLWHQDTRCLPFHPRVDQQDFAGYAKDMNNYERFKRAVNPQPASDAEMDMDYEYEPGGVLDNADTLLAEKLLYAFWRLCEQRIAVKSDAPINHSAKVLAERADVAPQVRIVRLRRADNKTGNDTGSGPEWHHRWVVRMHKVRQWHPKLGQHKILYRGPYLKGPAGKPLLPGETVRALVR